MIIKAKEAKQQNDKYRAGTVLLAVYQAIGGMSTSSQIKIDAVYNAIGQKVTIAKIRMYISRIGKENDMRFATRLIDNKLHVWRI